jgi:hypothetical protein
MEAAMPLNYSSDDAEDDLHRHVARCRKCWDARHIHHAEIVTERVLNSDHMCDDGAALVTALVTAIIEEAA